MCQEGIVHISEIPPLNVSSPFEVVITARPDKGIEIEIQAPPEIQFQPNNKLSFNESHQIETVYLTASDIGQYPISFEVTGINRIQFPAPDPILLVVIDPESMKQGYFDSYGLIEGVINPTCCESHPEQMCTDPNVLLTSSCSWMPDNENNYHTSGIVFSKLDDFNLLLSVGGASIGEKFDTLNVLERKNDCDCSKCNSSCCYHPTSSDIVTFYDKEALARSFLNVIKGSFPSWLGFTVENSIRSHTSTSHTVKLSSDLSLDECQHFPQVVLPHNPTLAILVYDGSIEVSVNNDKTFLTKLQPGISTVMCIAVNLCQGQSSPVYISLSHPMPSAINQISIFKQHGWDLKLTGIGVSKEKSIIIADGKGEEDFALALQGELKLQADLGSINVNFNFSGTAALVSSSLNQVG